MKTRFVLFCFLRQLSSGPNSKVGFFSFLAWSRAVLCACRGFCLRNAMPPNLGKLGSQFFIIPHLGHIFLISLYNHNFTSVKSCILYGVPLLKISSWKLDYLKIASFSEAKLEHCCRKIFPIDHTVH